MTPVGFDPPAQLGRVFEFYCWYCIHVKPHLYDQRRQSSLGYVLRHELTQGPVTGSTSTDRLLARGIDTPRHT
jgi:hypothetical protein